MIKKEARILGLSAPTGKLKRIPLIGVVFRGNLWLDGVLACYIEPTRPEDLSGLVEAVVHSRQYSQIRAVILSHEVLASVIRISVSDLSRIVNLPAISILRKRSHTGTIRVRIAGEHVYINTARVSGPEAQQIFEIACPKGKWIPEAVRVAGIIAKNLT